MITIGREGIMTDAEGPAQEPPARGQADLPGSLKAKAFVLRYANASYG